MSTGASLLKMTVNAVTKTKAATHHVSGSVCNN